MPFQLAFSPLLLIFVPRGDMRDNSLSKKSGHSTSFVLLTLP
jgi:hypothetical protein